MTVERMTGTPWHTEILRRSEGDAKRHRSRCIHYISGSKQCRCRNSRCIGSAHCDYYREPEPEVTNEAPPKPSPKTTQSKFNGKIFFFVGDRVRHQSWGEGTVTEVTTKIITVAFDDGMEKQLDVSACITKGLINLIG